jgi:flavin-dependent dehydrogenase
MSEMIQYKKELPVKVETDVFIAGGGPAGVSAAVAASEAGAKVFLAEASQSFGGAAVTMLVPAFMEFGNGKEFLAAGIGKRVFDYLAENAPESAKPYCPPNIPVETLKLCYDQMMDECGAEYIFQTQVTDVIVEHGEIQYVVCAGKGESYAVKAKVYIDCTGDADLCAYAGAEFEQGGENGEVMGSTLCGLWTGIQWENVVHPDSRMLEQAFKDHVFTQNDLHLPGMWAIAKGVGGSNVGHVFGVDGTDSESLTKGMVEARKRMQEYRRYYREYLSGFEDAELVCSAPQLGIRESRRVVCDYRLVLQDFLDQAVFPDEIGRYSYNIDIHANTVGLDDYELFEKEHTTYRYKAGESYGIPYRTLPVKGFSNLLTAGRSICSDRYMQSSVRVMPGCYITGQAAGTAAAICALGGIDVHQAPVKQVQKQLKKIGAYLPNYKE